MHVAVSATALHSKYMASGGIHRFRSSIGVVAIALIIFVSLVFAPDAHPGQARLICDPLVDATYSDISVCMIHASHRAGCSCVETFSAWTLLYFFAVMPTVVVLMALWTFVGSPMRRLVYLNLGVVLGWLAFLTQAVAREPMALMGNAESHWSNGGVLRWSFCTVRRRGADSKQET